MPSASTDAGKKPTAMFDDIYDATLIHVPEEEDVEMDGDLACPDCGELMFPDLTDEVLSAAVESPIAAPVDCPGCGADLEFSFQPLPIEEIGFGISVKYA